MLLVPCAVLPSPGPTLVWTHLNPYWIAPDPRRATLWRLIKPVNNMEKGRGHWTLNRIFRGFAQSIAYYLILLRGTQLITIL